MKKLYNEAEYEGARGIDYLPLECYNCKGKFLLQKKYIKSILSRGLTGWGKFCSNKCNGNFFDQSVKAPCSQCGKEVSRMKKEVRKSKSKLIFCNLSCSASYNNTHKKVGVVRSKLEIWMENKLESRYPNLIIKYNEKSAIQSELDIYIPSLQIAFELNGIFHYQPIFGEVRLVAIQNMDGVKKIACEKAGIKLHSIDISEQKRFTPSGSLKYLDIVVNHIEALLW